MMTSWRARLIAFFAKLFTAKRERENDEHGGMSGW